MRSLLALGVVVAVAGFTLADDWTGKTVTVTQDGLKFGTKLGGGLVRQGADVDTTKTYTVKSDDGTILELDGGFIFKSEAAVAADVKPFPKPRKDGEKVDTGGWFGKKLLPKRHTSEIRIGTWEDGKQVTWKPKNLLNCTVREDRDGFLRVYDGRWEGWVSKDDMVTAEDAPIYFDKAVKANPNDANAWSMRGLGWKDKGEYDNAIKDFTEAIRLKPDASAHYTCRGNAWLAKKEYDKAIADYAEAIRLDPKSAVAFNNRGVAWRNKKEYDKAIADYTEALRLDPKNANAFNYLAWLHGCCPVEKFRDGKKATEYGKKLVELDPSGANRDTLAVAYAEAGDFESAVAEQRKALDDKSLDKEDRAAMEKRLQLYRDKKPYRDEE